MNDLATDTALACFNAFAEPIEFNGKEIQGIPETQQVEFGGYDRVVETRMTVTVMLSDAGEIKSGMPVVIRGKTYQVDHPGADKLPEDVDVIASVVLR